MARHRWHHLPWRLVALLLARTEADGDAFDFDPTSDVRPVERGEDMAEYDVFVSYAAPDAAWVEGFLLDALTAAGVTAHTEEAFALGQPRLLEFERAVRNSRWVLLVISPAYFAEDSGGFLEVLAQSHGEEAGTWPVVPLLLKPASLPPRLRMLVPLDATDPVQWETALSRLGEHLHRPVPAPAPPPACPYPGMRPFTLADAALFHGRETESANLLQHLHAQRTAANRFLAVIGPSGSGKSSLTFAGLIPALQDSALFGTGSWQVLSLRPGTSPMTTSTTVLGTESPQPGPTVPDLLGQPPSGPRLVIVDQFEELFTVTARQAPDQVEPFQQALSQLAAMTNSFTVITVRADFYDDLMVSPLWHLIRDHRVEVLPLDEAGLRRAITQPAEAIGVYVEAALVERLAADAAGEPGVLPLVQQTLVLLWDHLERRYLPLKAYEALVLPQEANGGSPFTGRTGLEVAVARHADAVLGDLTTDQQRIARRVFLRLIQFGEGRADTRRQRHIDELCAAGDDQVALDATIERLVANRLLTLSGEPTLSGDLAPQVHVDLAHEALIGGWPWLQKLLVERREAEQVRERLEGKAAEWIRLGRGTSGLLDEAELAEAERWLAGPDAAELGYSPKLPELVAASRAALAREQQRLQHRMYGAIAFAVIALIAAIIAFDQFLAAESNANRAQAESNDRATEVVKRSTAEAQAEASAGTAEAERNHAHIEQLMAISGNLLDDQLELAALLAMESNRISDTPETRAAIAAVLDASPHFAGYLQGGSDSGYAMTYSPDGQMLAIARNGGVDFRDAESGDHLELSIGGHTGPVNSLMFSADGTLLATGGEDGEVRLWDVSSGEPHGTPMEGHDAPVESIDFSPDGRTLVSGDFDGIVIIWDVESQQMVGEPIATAAEVTSVAFSPDGDMVAVGGDYDSIVLLSSDSHREVGKLTTGGIRFRYSTSLEFSSSTPTLLAAGDSDGVIRLWDVTTGDQVGPALSGHKGPVGTVAFSSDGEILASGGYDGTVRLWNVDSRQPIGEPLRGHGRIVADIAFRPKVNTDMLVSLGDDGRFVFWTIDPHSRLSAVIAQIAALGANLPVTDLIFSPDGEMVISPLPRVTFWDADSPQKALRVLSIPFPVQSLALNPQNPDMLAAGGSNGTIVFWNARTDEALGPSMPGHAGAVRSIAFNSDGTVLASGGVDGTVRLWDVQQQVPLGEPITGYVDVIDCVAFSPGDPTLLAFGGKNGTLILWDTESGGPIGEPLDLHTGRVQSIAFQPHGQVFASGSSDGRVRLWSVSPAQAAGVLRIENASSVLAVAFSPDGRVLAAADASGNVHLWDVSSREPLAPPLAGHSSLVISLAFSPDSTRLVSGGLDGNILIWDIDIEVWRERACELAGRNLTADEWDEYFPGEPYHVTCSQFPSGAVAPEATPEDVADT